MKGKWVLSVCAGLVSASLLLAGCSSGGNASTPQVQTPEQSQATSQPTSQAMGSQGQKFTIGYDVYYLGNSWSVQMYQEFKSAAEKHPDQIADVVYTQSDNQAEKQVSNIQSMIAKKVDAIIMTPVSPSAAVPVIEQAKNAGIPVILLAATADTKDYTALVTVDDFQYGKTQAEWLAKRLNGKGNIYVLNGIAGIAVDSQRWQGAQSVFGQYPDIHVVASQYANWDEATAKTVVSNMLAAHPDVDGVWSQGGSMTLGAIEAFEAAGHSLVPMTGEDNNGLLKKWKQLRDSGNAQFDCIAVAKPTWLAEEALNVTLDILGKKPYQKDSILPPPVITSDTLGQYVRPDLPDSVWDNTHLTDQQLKDLFAH